MADPIHELVRKILDEELDTAVKDAMRRHLDGFQDRLATAMEKALDRAEHDLRERLRSLEEDQAQILRHLGLDES